MPYQYPIRFGKYFLTRRVAVGGMAEVFKAKMVGIKGFEKLVAVKRILPEFNEDEEFVQMFVDEARIASHLVHGHIVQVFDFGEVDGAYYMAMEYVDGPNLRNLVQRCMRTRGRFPKNLSLFIVQSIAKGLEFAHNARVGEEEEMLLVHRDVSPQNILISRHGEVKITDFGIAKAKIKLTQTEPGKIQGKFSYMSPEQAAGKPLDRRSDIFSLGIILYELLSGVKLYAEEDTHKRYREVREANIPSLGMLVPDISGLVESLTMSMLERSPEDRPRTCGEVVARLTEVLSEISTDGIISEMGQIIDELFPPEQSDSFVERRIAAMAETGEKGGSDADATEAVRAQGREQTGWTRKLGRGEEDTVPNRLMRWIGLPLSTWILSALLIGAAGLWYSTRGADRTTPSPTPETPAAIEADPEVREPDPPDTTLEESPVGPVDSDLRFEAEAREAETARRLRELEIQLTTAERDAAAARRAQEEAERALVEGGPALPPCPADMVLIEGGEFVYGSDPEDPDRNTLVEAEAVQIPINRFCIDRYEYPNRKGALPRTSVTWDEAQELCAGLNKRLCRQEEWERSCKGPLTRFENRRFPYGNGFDPAICNVAPTGPGTSASRDGGLAPSGEFASCVSHEGVHDLSGNADEWTESRGSFTVGTRVTRGGAANRRGLFSRCTSLRELLLGYRETDVGFRCCKDAR